MLVAEELHCPHKVLSCAMLKYRSQHFAFPYLYSWLLESLLLFRKRMESQGSEMSILLYIFKIAQDPKHIQWVRLMCSEESVRLHKAPQKCKNTPPKHSALVLLTAPSEGSHVPLRLLVTQNSFSCSLCTKPLMHHTPSWVWWRWSITQQYCPHVFGCTSALVMRYSWRTCTESVGFPNPHSAVHK